MDIKRKLEIADTLKINFNKLNDTIADLAFLQTKFAKSPNNMLLTEYREMRKLDAYIDELNMKYQNICKNKDGKKKK